MRLRFGPFVFDSATRELLQERRPVHLSPKSFDLLQILIERRPALYRRYIRLVVQQLDSARSGARLCTYWGFGGNLPPGWELEASEEVGTGRLELWIKS